MHDERTDRIAREAARLMQTGAVESIDAAVRRATESLKLFGTPLPTYGRVRQHAQAMRMQAMGGTAYAQWVRDVLRIAEQMMTILTELAAGDGTRGGGQVECLLVGRGAKGQFDADPTLHIRAYTDVPISRLADALVEQGYEEPVFRTVQTMRGRMNRLELTEEGIAVVVTRCAPAMMRESTIDLFTGERIAVLPLEDLRHRLINPAGER